MKIYHRTLTPEGHFNASKRTLNRLKTRKREKTIHNNGTFVGNLKETYKFGPAFTPQQNIK